MALGSVDDGSFPRWPSARFRRRAATAKCEFSRAMAVGEEAEVSDAVEAVGQGVQKEVADELVRLQPHELGGAALAIIFPGEGDAIVIESFYAAVGDGDAMGVAAEVSEDLLWAADGLLA